MLDKRREVVELEIRRSREWKESWVGKETCCFRSKESRRSRKGRVPGDEGSLTWRLKSPEMNISEDVEQREARDSEKSLRKIEVKLEGGR